MRSRYPVVLLTAWFGTQLFAADCLPANGGDIIMTPLMFAGVTECVPEVKALRNIDVAFVPINLPLERMTPQATAECIKARVVAEAETLTRVPSRSRAAVARARVMSG